MGLYAYVEWLKCNCPDDELLELDWNLDKMDSGFEEWLELELVAIELSEMGFYG